MKVLFGNIKGQVHVGDGLVGLEGRVVNQIGTTMDEQGRCEQEKIKPMRMDDGIECKSVFEARREVLDIHVAVSLGALLTPQKQCIFG